MRLNQAEVCALWGRQVEGASFQKAIAICYQEIAQEPCTEEDSSKSSLGIHNLIPLIIVTKREKKTPILIRHSSHLLECTAPLNSTTGLILNLQIVSIQDLVPE